MIIRRADFILSIVDPTRTPPRPLPQVAFVGRSNVGKSSLINRLLGRTRKGIAKVSGTPGKTQALNYFEVNDAFYLVDLPGYGFAKAPKPVREGWRHLIQGYLTGPAPPRGIVQLIDIRHPPTREDREMIERLAGLGLPTLVVLTKADKVGKEKARAAVLAVAETLDVDPEQILPFSSKTGQGRDLLLESLASLLGLEDEPPSAAEVG